MLLIEVSLSLEQKRKLLRMSRETGKTFGQLTALALDAMLLEHEEQAGARSVVNGNRQKLSLQQPSTGDRDD